MSKKPNKRPYKRLRDCIKNLYLLVDLLYVYDFFTRNALFILKKFDKLSFCNKINETIVKPFDFETRVLVFVLYRDVVNV